MDKTELAKIKTEALEEHIPIIMDDTLKVVTDILKKNNPKSILEIGTAIGYSAICFSEFMQEIGTIDTIEKDIQRAEKANQNIKRAKVDVKVNIYCGDAIEILPKLNRKYDIIFIDASKSKYPFFLEQSIEKLNGNGIIIADNILYKGYVMGNYDKHKQRTAVKNLREYIKMVTNNPNLQTEILDVGDGLAVTKVLN